MDKMPKYDAKLGILRERRHVAEFADDYWQWKLADVERVAASLADTRASAERAAARLHAADARLTAAYELTQNDDERNQS